MVLITFMIAQIPMLIVVVLPDSNHWKGKMIVKNPTLGLTSTIEDSCQGVGSNNSCSLISKDKGIKQG